MLALRFMGAVHRRVLEGCLSDLEKRYSTAASAEAWPAFREAVSADAEAIEALLDRPVQTNEVARCAALLPGFLTVASVTGLPLRLLEVGSSAGLNLHWDAYRYEADGFEWGDPAASVRIDFDLAGEMPDATEVEVRERRGCDPRPIDPSSEEGQLTLLSFVWPDQRARLERLRAALRAAGERPAEKVERAGAAEWIAGRLVEPGEGVATVVFHSIVMQYLEEDERREFERTVQAAGSNATERSPLAWLRMEPAGERAEVRLTLWPDGEERIVARAGYHGDLVDLRLSRGG
jgi:hypothetical protein